MGSLINDLRFGMRNLFRTRGVTVVAIITLALGIGANTAIFSIINAVLLQPLPFSNPGQLVRLYETEAAPGNYPFSPPDFVDWKTQSKSFADMTIYLWGSDFSLVGGSAPQHILGVPVENNFFNLLGAKPMLGRTFAADEDKPGSDQVAVLSYSLWKSQFGGDGSIVGRQVELSAKQYTVIGVMPPSFHYPGTSAMLWVPQPMDTKSLGTRGSHWANAIGRLKPGVTLEQAQAEVSLIAKRLEDQYPNSNYKVGASLVPLHDDMVDHSRASLVMMMWSVVLVLLIACANVANLLLSRAVARQREMAIRSALGAARARLVRQLLTESLLLALLGGACGVLVGSALLSLLTSLKAFGLPATNPIELSLPVLFFTFAVSSVAGVLFGLFPALQTVRSEIAFDELKGGAGSAISHSRQRRFVSNGLVVAEVGFSLLLLISAGLLLKDFVQLRNSNIGVRTEGVWTAAIRLPQAKYKEPQQLLNFAQDLIARVRQVPGVESAALSDRVPLEGGSNNYIKLPGQGGPRFTGPLVESHGVTPGYFHALGVPLLQGRDFNDKDIADAFVSDGKSREAFKNNPPDFKLSNAILYPAVINETMAKDFWPDKNPIGQVYSPGGENGPWREVVGVVADVKQWGAAQAARPEGYDVFDGDTRYYIMVHSSLPEASVTAAVRDVLHQVDSSMPLFSVRTMDEVLAENTAGEQFITLLIGMFAGLALLLAAVGIYGVLSYLVTQRTREIGIRMSLGANHIQVMRMVMRQGFRLAVFGFVLGIAGALAARKLLASSLHNVKPHDPGIFALTVGFLALIALLACYIPARRAARVDPMVALRHE